MATVAKGNKQTVVMATVVIVNKQTVVMATVCLFTLHLSNTVAPTPVGLP